MKQWGILIACLSLFSMAQAAKDYGLLRVKAGGTTIYHGADLNSKPEARAEAGEEFVLLADSLIHGFYKIAYEGHVSFIYAGDVVRVQRAQATPPPLQKPTPAQTKLPTFVPTRDTGEDEPRPLPLKSPTLGPVEEKSTPVATKLSTFVPTPFPTKAPTVALTRETEKEQPTQIPTKAPTVEPTRETENEQPTHVPTKAPTVPPTREPEKEQPTQMPTKASTPAPTREPEKEQSTPVPTKAPTTVPTRVLPRSEAPTAVPTTVPAPMPGPAVAKGRRLRSNTAKAGLGAAAVFAGASTTRRSVAVSKPAQTFYGPQRPIQKRPWNKLSDITISIPIGGGPCVPVQPAFKPEAASMDRRCIDSAAFAGLGLEGRTRLRWLRIFGDWTAHQHSTLAARSSKTATAVDVPGLLTLSFPESDVQYRMNTQGLRLGLKVSLPFPIVEPWVGGGLGAYYWQAEYTDSGREIGYGGDKGWAFGATALAGVDFSVPTSWGLFVFTPFVEYGTPTVNPLVVDIAGTGANWKDNFGTPVMMPWRAGLGIGFGF